MAKRKLTRRQQWRQSKIQSERRARAEKKLASLESAQLGPEQTGLLIARYGAKADVEAPDSTIHSCFLRQNLDFPVPGDKVVWCEAPNQSGVISAILPRRTTLARPDNSGQLKPLAANITRMAIVIAPDPTPTQELIDRYLACAELLELNPLIVFNKADICAENHNPIIAERLHLFQTIGYEVIEASCHSLHGMDELEAALRDNTSIFVGQSGVGKSSLISTLLPEEAIKIGELSDKTGFGKHTTSTAKLYHLPAGGQLIDSPGVRNFKLWSTTPLELLEGFKEFRPFIGQCKFRNCRHFDEPACALQQAVKDKKILKLRLDSYLNIARSL